VEWGDESRRFLRPLAAGLSLAAVYVAVVAIPLDAADELGLSSLETSAWILAVWGLPGVLTIVLTIRYRQPIPITGNIFILIFILSLGGGLSWPELVGATVVAGAIVLVLGVTGLTHRLARLLPAPIVYGLLAGALLDPLLSESITSLGTSTLLIGSTFLAYFLSEAVLGKRVPALLSALVVGVVVAVLSSQVGPLPALTLPEATSTLPQFTFEALVTATPVLVIFITLQANAPSVVYLRSQDFDPPERAISLVSGVGTILGSFFGPMGVSLSLPATALTAGPDAGEHDVRRWAAYVAAVASLMVALSAGFASDLLDFIPSALLDAIVGLAALAILARALAEVTKGPLILGPVVAFAVSVSELELLGLGRFFWAIVFGIGVSLLVERAKWSQI
jgi:benzoate membrane transport protein